MSKDGSAGGGTNISIEDLLANNPDLMEQVANTPAAQTSAPVEQSAPIPFYGSGNEISQPDQTYFDSFSPSENFYGSGTEITQPDADYYGQFPLPGQAPAQTQAPRPTSTPIPIFDMNEYDDSEIFDGRVVGGEGGAGGYGETVYQPVYGRQGVTPAMPILDAAEEEEIAYYNPRFSNFNIGTM